MKIRINEEECTGCGVCSDTCPEIFELGDDDLAHVKDSNPADTDCAKEAAESYPTEAIIIEE